MDIAALWQSIINALNYPPRLHAMATHLPVAATMLGIVLLLVLLGTGGKSPGFRWSCFLVFLAATVGAAASMFTGEMALDMAPTDAWTDAAMHAGETHEWMGELAWIPLLVTTALVGLTAIKHAGARAVVLTLATIAALAAAGWISITAHYGGDLVYEHGINTGPRQVTAAPAPQTSNADPANEAIPQADESEQESGRSFFGIPLE